VLELTDSVEVDNEFEVSLWFTDSGASVVPAPLRRAASWSPVMQTFEPSDFATHSVCVLTWPKLPTAGVNDWAKPEMVFSMDVISAERA
jgi:hypothetical protein